MEVPPLLKPGDLLRGRLKVVKRINGGGFGQIYKAFDNTEKREVAIKAETAGLSKQVLPLEVAVLQSIHGKPHAPRFFGSGSTAKYK